MMDAIGRNDPCHCGSGRKYKRCHLAEDKAAQSRAAAGEAGPRASVEKRRAAVHDLDERLVEQMGRFACKRFGAAWGAYALDAYPGEIGEERATTQLVGPWSFYHYPFEGRPVAAWFAEARGEALSEKERSWLAAQAESWPAVLEVTGVDEGVGLTLEDLLTGETHVVQEVSGSRCLVKRDAILGRVIDHDGISVLCGIHHKPLPPKSAATVVEVARSMLRCRKRKVAATRMREPLVADLLITIWEQAVRDLESRPPPKLVNTDGEDLIMTKDRFWFGPAVRGQIESRLVGLEGAEAEESDEGETIVTFVRPGNKLHKSWDNTIVGRAVLAADTLDLETNSRPRADRLREVVELACGALVVHRTREETHSDDLLRQASTRTEPDEPRPAPPPEILQAMREMKERDFEEWVDRSIPALGGLTPREAARSRGAVRSELDVILKDIERRESRLPVDEQYDVAVLRRSLGLERTASRPGSERDVGGARAPAPSRAGGRRASLRSR
jgi:hypothetical protein